LEIAAVIMQWTGAPSVVPENQEVEEADHQRAPSLLPSFDDQTDVFAQFTKTWDCPPAWDLVWRRCFLLIQLFIVDDTIGLMIARHEPPLVFYQLGGSKMRRLLGLSLLVAGAAVFASAKIPAAPEIDASSALSALALISGAALVIRGRRK
jgi:hypothetical protein